MDLTGYVEASLAIDAYEPLCSLLVSNDPFERRYKKKNSWSGEGREGEGQRAGSEKEKEKKIKEKKRGKRQKRKAEWGINGKSITYSIGIIAIGLAATFSLADFPFFFDEFRCDRSWHLVSYWGGLWKMNSFVILFLHITMWCNE